MKKSPERAPVRRGVALVLGFALVFNTLLIVPQRAQAQWLTFDASSFVQNTITAVQSTITAGESVITSGNSISDNLFHYVLSPLAWAVAKAAINAMTQSIVNWINSGFHGSPAFATNLNNSLRQLGDGIAAAFLDELLNNTSINSPYIQRVAGTVARGYLLYTSRDAITARLQYTLGQYSSNEQAFRQGQFNQGGFNAWFAMTRQCGNDPYCVQYAAQEELVNRIDAVTRQRLEELDWGRGFLSWRDCPDTTQSDGTDTTVGVTQLSDADTSSGCTIKTPGSILEDAMGITATSPLRQLELADSFNEIVGALASQLVTHIFGATGLLGASEPSSGGGRSILDQATDPNQNASTTASLISGFQQAVTTERARTITNQTAWQEFRTIAEQAVAKCSGSTTTKSQQATDALAQANTMIAKAETNITALTGILDHIAALNSQPSANYSAAAVELTAEYNQILSGGSVGAPNGTLKSQLQAIIANGCN